MGTGNEDQKATGALDVWSRSKDAAVKPGLEQDDTIQWKQGSSNPNLPFLGWDVGKCALSKCRDRAPRPWQKCSPSTFWFAVMQRQGGSKAR